MAAAIGVVFPNQDGRGSQVTVSGAGVAKYAMNRDNAVNLLEFLRGDRSQEYYTASNCEYPVKPDGKLSPAVQAWGRLKADESPPLLLDHATTVSRRRKLASPPA